MPEITQPKHVADVLVIHNVSPGKGGADAGVLLVRAVWNLDNPKGWQMPGGHVEPGETPEQAAQREADEELGAGAIRVGRKLAQLTEADGTIAHIYEGHLNFARPPEPDGQEIAEYNWFAASIAADHMNDLSAALFRAGMKQVRETA